ncbi:hypothetical protein NDU88_011779, partial [Pleurodeles waltl]
VWEVLHSSRQEAEPQISGVGGVTFIVRGEREDSAPYPSLLHPFTIPRVGVIVGSRPPPLDEARPRSLLMAAVGATTQALDGHRQRIIITQKCRVKGARRVIC